MLIYYLYLTSIYYQINKIQWSIYYPCDWTSIIQDLTFDLSSNQESKEIIHIERPVLVNKSYKTNEYHSLSFNLKIISTSIQLHT